MRIILWVILIFPLFSCEVLSLFALHDIAWYCPWSCWLITKNHQTLQWHPLGKGCLPAWNANLGEGLGCFVFSDILGCLNPLPGAASVERGLTLTNKMLPPYQQACCWCCFQSSKGRILSICSLPTVPAQSWMSEQVSEKSRDQWNLRRRLASSLARQEEQLNTVSQKSRNPGHKCYYPTNKVSCFCDSPGGANL